MNCGILQSWIWRTWSNFGEDGEHRKDIKHGGYVLEFSTEMLSGSPTWRTWSLISSGLEKVKYNQGAGFQVIANNFLLYRNCFLWIKEIHTLPDLEREGWLSKEVIPGQVLIEEVADDWHVAPEGDCYWSGGRSIESANHGIIFNTQVVHFWGQLIFGQRSKNHFFCIDDMEYMNIIRTVWTCFEMVESHQLSFLSCK